MLCADYELFYPVFFYFLSVNRLVIAGFLRDFGLVDGNNSVVIHGLKEYFNNRGLVLRKLILELLTGQPFF